MRKRLVGIFLKVANKLIIRIRAGKRLVKIKTRFTERSIHNREDAKRMVAEDWKSSLNMRSGGEDDADNIQNVRFEFSFNKKTLAKMSEIKLPIEYETNIASFMEKIDAQPVINFDDLEAYDPIQQLDYEVEKYKPLPIPAVSSYDPVFHEKNYRPGCQYESTLRQISGEPDLEKTQMNAHLQMEMLKQKTKDIVSKANVAMPNSFVKPLDYSIDLLVR